MIVQLKTVEFWRDRRGPGPRNQSDATGTYSTHKVKPGEKDASPTGLRIFLDTDLQAVLVTQPEAKEDPVVIIPWSDVRRSLPADPAKWLPKPEKSAA